MRFITAVLEDVSISRTLRYPVTTFLVISDIPAAANFNFCTNDAGLAESSKKVCYDQQESKRKNEFAASAFSRFRI